MAATLSQRNLRIDKIREQDASPGLHDFEANFLRLIEKITDGISTVLSFGVMSMIHLSSNYLIRRYLGCSIEINETGTSLRYKPGLITGSSMHLCS